MTAWMLAAFPAQAAIYCVEATGMEPQCHYHDARQCERDAQAAQGACMVNGESITSVTGTERFCLVMANGFAQCLYADVNTCGRDARRNNSICMNNTLRNNRNSPYRYELNAVN